MTDYGTSRFSLVQAEGFGKDTGIAAEPVPPRRWRLPAAQLMNIAPDRQAVFISSFSAHQ